MKIISNVSFCFFVLVTSFSCKSNKQALSSIKFQEDNSKISIDWPGTYQGILPCADCEGIQTQLVLNKDLSYSLKTRYNGKSDSIFQTKGTFKWNENRSSITLDNLNKHLYQVGENRLIQRDKDGSPVTEGLTNKFILQKEKIELTGNYWKLTMLNGKPVKTSSREPFVRFTVEDTRVNGNSSCNMFNGIFELTVGNRIKISSLAITKMACVGNSIESEFMQIFEKTTNYSLTANELLLQDEFETTLAKFEADYFK